MFGYMAEMGGPRSSSSPSSSKGERQGERRPPLEETLICSEELRSWLACAFLRRRIARYIQKAIKARAMRAPTIRPIMAPILCLKLE